MKEIFIFFDMHFNHKGIIRLFIYLFFNAVDFCLKEFNTNSLFDVLNDYTFLLP